MRLSTSSHSRSTLTTSAIPRHSTISGDRAGGSSAGAPGIHLPSIDAGRGSRTPSQLGFLRFCALIAVLFSGYLFAGEADVVNLEIIKISDGQFRINATVAHDDTGWQHYANRWDVLAPDGTVLDARVLAHPHENEQPFTRSLMLSIPTDVLQVTVRANDLVHELGGAEMSIDVPH